REVCDGLQTGTVPGNVTDFVVGRLRRPAVRSCRAGGFGPWHERATAMIDTNILLVDDERDSCASMSDIFLDLGYTVDVAYDGPGALELSGGHRYRLALLDYNMPGMD